MTGAGKPRPESGNRGIRCPIARKARPGESAAGAAERRAIQRLAERLRTCRNRVRMRACDQQARARCASGQKTVGSGFADNRSSGKTWHDGGPSGWVSRTPPIRPSTSPAVQNRHARRGVPPTRAGSGSNPSAAGEQRDNADGSRAFAEPGADARPGGWTGACGPRGGVAERLLASGETQARGDWRRQDGPNRSMREHASDDARRPAESKIAVVHPPRVRPAASDTDAGRGRNAGPEQGGGRAAPVPVAERLEQAAEQGDGRWKTARCRADTSVWLRKYRTPPAAGARASSARAAGHRTRRRRRMR